MLVLVLVLVLVGVTLRQISERERQCHEERRIRLWNGFAEQPTEDLDELRIKLDAGVLAQLVDRCLMTDSGLVRPVVDHGVIGIGDGHDARAERNVAAAETVRISVAAEAFVVMQDDGSGVPHRGDAINDHLADAWMLNDGLPLIWRERAGLLQDLLRDADLADVVKQRGDSDPFDFLIR